MEMRRFRVAAVVLFFYLLPRFDSNAQSSRTEIFDAPDVRIDAVDSQTSGFYVSKSNDLRLRCSIRSPVSVRLSDSTRQIVWKYNEADVTKAGLPQGSFQVDRETLLLKASVDAELLVGKYSCNVTWPTYGSSLSPPVQVQLATLKKFKNDQSREERVVVGHTAYLPCPSSETTPAPASKLWFVMNGTKEIIFSNDRYFLTPTGLQIGRVEKADRGSYVCRAVNPVSGQTRDSKPIELIVLDDVASSTTAKTSAVNHDEQNHVRPSPHLHQRNIVDARRGDNVTLECVMITGPGRTTAVRWEKYGRVLPPVERRKHVFGNMILTNVTKEDEGSYICRGGTNGDGGSDGSNSDKRGHSAPRYIMYSLRVFDPLRAKLSIERDAEEDKSRSSGLAYRLTCQAGSGLASELEFWVNGTPLLSQPFQPIDTKFHSGESPKWTFILSESTLRKGVYQCMARGRGPFDESTVQSDSLYVDSTFVAGRSPGDDGNDETTSEEIGGVTRPYDGEQAAGSSWRRQPPRITMAPENETTTIGSPVTFVCQVTSNTDVVYWLKDGERIFDYYPDEEDDEDDAEEQSSATRKYKRIGTGSLHMETTTNDDRGWYTCVAVNSFGNTTAKAYLEFEPPIIGANERTPTNSRTYHGNSASADEDDAEDDRPRNDPTTKATKRKKIRMEAPEVHRYSNTSVLLRWTMTSEQRRANAGIRFFKLQYRKAINTERDPPWKTLDQELPNHSHSGTIDGLEPGQKYKFRFAVVYDNNDQAVSRISPPFEMIVERKQSPPRMAPTLTSAKAISWSAIGLSWDYPLSEQAPVDGFIITYRRIYYADTSPVNQNETVIGGWTREHVLSPLIPTTLYQIKIVAFNTAGRSRESNTIEETTLSTDGTRPPRTFDATGLLDRPYANGGNNPVLKADAAANSAVTPMTSSSDVSWPPAYANRTDKNTGVLGWLNVKTATLVYVAGGVVGAIFLILIVFMVVCAVRQRHHKKLINAAQGKYRDTSKKIYREQSACNDRTIMKEMYPPISNSTSFQHSTAETVDDEDDHDGCPPPPPAPSQSGLGLSRANGHIPPPPSMTGYAANGSLRPGIIMNLYTNPLDYDNGGGLDDDRKPANRGGFGILSRTTTDFADGEEGDDVFSAEDRLLGDNYGVDCDLNKNDVCYGIRGLNGLNSSINNRHHRPVPPPLILTSASALTSGGPFANSFNHNMNFLSSSSPHASVTSNYSSSNGGDAHSSSTNGLGGGGGTVVNNHTPLLPPPLFAQQHQLNGDLVDSDGEKKAKRIPTPVPPHQKSASTSSSNQKSDTLLRTEKNHRHQRLDDGGSSTTMTRNGGVGHHQHTNGGLLNGAASPMSVSSHASIGSGSGTSASGGGGGGGSRPNFSTFKPEPKSTDSNNRHHNRNNLLMYRNRLSDGYCSDA